MPRRVSLARLRRNIVRSFNNPDTLIYILRFVLALAFALPAFIFSEVIPNDLFIDRNVLRVLITFWFGLLGYGLFTNIAKIITLSLITLINNFVNKITTEVMDQLLRLPKQNVLQAPFADQAPVGGVSVNQPLIIDTSAIIDGRVLDIARTGFLFGTVLVPTFVLTELQRIADSPDFLKRSRGRRGFEVIEELKKIKGLRVQTWDKDVFAKTVDEKLLKLTKNLHGKIITTDFNLNKVASLSNVVVLNVNDLSNAVKTISIPGEQLKIKVVHLGKDPKQGVGYLPDGTMVVLENGADLIGEEVITEVTRVIQVPAGRMIFTKKIS